MIKRFNRFELKYIINMKKAEDIIFELLKHTIPDSHGGLKGYKISSLYYDSQDLDFFWDKIEGIKFRRKVRIRVYPKDNYEDINEAMVEIKQRINRTVQKRRLKLSLDDAYKLCAGEYTERNLDFLDEQVASEIDYIVSSKNLQPSCVIEYHRKAFIGDIYNPGLRITFDTNLKYRIKDFQLNQHSENYFFLPPDHCVMEVKANEVIPDWVTSMVARHNCQVKRISKYCTGIAHAYKLPVMHLAVAPVYSNGGLKVG